MKVAYRIKNVFYLGKTCEAVRTGVKNLKMNIKLLHLFIAIVFPFLISCNSASKKVKSKDISSNETLTQVRVSDDSVYLTFGKVFKVENPSQMSFFNPHKVAQYSFFKCSQGQTNELLNEMTHVEKDTALGESFLTFLREFGPDVEHYKNETVYLKFHGYWKNETTTVWYYYLANESGTLLEHNPWISLHRSIETGRCALTGIFLYYPDEDIDNSMPNNIITDKCYNNASR